jgi:glutaredoxin
MDRSPVGRGPFCKDRHVTGERVRLLGKPGCHLCDDARDVVSAVCAELSVAWSEVDVRTDAALFSKYGEYIPVVFVDGEQHDFWRVSPERLRAALTQTLSS